MSEEEEEEIELLKTIFVHLYKFETVLLPGWNRKALITSVDDTYCRLTYMENDSMMRFKWETILEKIKNGEMISKEFEIAKRNINIDKII